MAAYREPAVVFIDEIDSLLTQRKSDENEASRRIKTEFLVQLGAFAAYFKFKFLCSTGMFKAKVDSVCLFLCDVK